MALQTHFKETTHRSLVVRQSKAEEVENQAVTENIVTFTSFDGTVRGVGSLPSNLARATALANEKSVLKIWGTSEEEDACRAMRKGI